MEIAVTQPKPKPLADKAIVIRAIGDSFRKLHPRTMIKNPVMFGSDLCPLRLARNAVTLFYLS